MSDASPLTFPPELPISARVTDIAIALNAHPVVIVAGATGSGKTTQLPKIALAMGRGIEQQIGRDDRLGPQHERRFIGSNAAGEAGIAGDGAR